MQRTHITLAGKCASEIGHGSGGSKMLQMQIANVQSYNPFLLSAQAKPCDPVDVFPERLGTQNAGLWSTKQLEHTTPCKN